MSLRKPTVTPRTSKSRETPTKDTNVARDQLMAASIGNVDWLRLCMTAADSQVKADRYGFTALHMAAIHNRLQCLRLLLEDYGMDVDVPTAYEWRPLHLVMNQKSARRAVQCLRYLLQRGADVNTKSKNLTTPLHRAASAGLEDCIAELVKAGADLHAQDSEGKKPIDLCHIWCRRSSARYLRSAMWRKDKEDYTQELKKMEKIKHNLEELEEDASLQMQIPFCDSRKAKNLMENLNRGTLPTCKSGHQDTYSSNRQGAKSMSSEKIKKGKTDKESNTKVISPKERGEEVSDGRRSAAKNSFWNASSNPHCPPPVYLNRVPTLWQGAYPEVTRKDLSSRIVLTKDEHGQLQIQTLRGRVFSAPSLPYEVLERSLFPTRGPQDRIQIPKDFKATHVFDVPRKQQSQKPPSEISFHLRRNLDSKFTRSNRIAN